MKSAIRLVAALVAGAISLTAAAGASAGVVQTFGNTGPDRLRFPGPIVYGPDGLLRVLDRGDAARDPVFVRVYTPAGARVGGFRPAVGPEGFLEPMAADAAGATYVGVEGAVLKYSLAGALLARFPVEGPAADRPSAPVGVGIDGAGRLVTLEAQSSRVDTFDPAGRLVASFRVPDSLYRRGGLAVSSSGALYAWTPAGFAILDSAGTVVRRLSRPPILDPFGVVTDGPGGTVYTIAHHRIQKLGAGGEYLGGVGTDRKAGGMTAAIGPDGTIYATTWNPLARDLAGAVLKLDPITTVDATAPALVVTAFVSPPLPRRVGPRTKMVLGRMVLTASEDATYRWSVKRRATTKNRRHRQFGRYLHLGTVDVPHIAPGAHPLALDWRAIGYGERIPGPGRYQLNFVATDASGNESRPARVTFTVTRRRR